MHVQAVVFSHVTHHVLGWSSCIEVAIACCSVACLIEQLLCSML